jgi:putative tributyrin esterase
MFFAASALPGVDLRHDARSIGRCKTARVLVPTGTPPRRGWRSFYLLHGFGGDRLTWSRHLDLHGLRQCEDMLFIFPESGRRWFINDVSGNRYEDYVVSDLVSAVDANYPTDPRASSRIIGGFSMGGAAAVYLSLRHPRIFSASFSYAGAFYASRREGDPYSAYRSQGCMMPTEEEHDRVWGPPGSRIRAIYDPDTLIDEAVTNSVRPNMVIEAGTCDYPRVIEQNRRMHTALLGRSLQHVYRECEGDHSWASAAASTKRAIRQLTI